MKWIQLAVPIVLVFDIIVMLFAHNYKEQSFNAHHEMLYDMHVNDAADAAIYLGAVDSINAGMTYWDLYDIDIDPTWSLAGYANIMCRSLGWYPSAANIQAVIDEYTAGFVVVTCDGVYSLEVNDHVNSTANPAIKQMSISPVWRPKQAFTAKTSDPNKIAILHLGNSFELLDTSTGNAEVKLYKDYPEIENQKGNIVKQVNTLLNLSLGMHNNTGRTGKAILIPNGERNGVLGIDKPCVIAVFKDANVISGAPLIAVGGSSVEYSEQFICYRRNGVNCYTYASNRAYVESQGISIHKTYSSAEECSADGYYYDLLFLE